MSFSSLSSSSGSSRNGLGSGRSGHGGSGRDKLGSVRATGQIFVSPDLSEMAHRPLKKLSVKIMETPLHGPLGSIARRMGANGHGLIGKHDYILIEYGTPGEWIKAEKTGESVSRGRHAGLHLTLETEPGDGVVRHEVKINGPGVRWTMGQLLDILTNHDPDYDLLDGNCWKYAFYCADAILKWCISNARDENARYILQRELEMLQPVERPMPKATLDWLRKPTDPASIRTGKLIEQKLTHTEEKLKPYSFRRSVLVPFLDTVRNRNLRYNPGHY